MAQLKIMFKFFKKLLHNTVKCYFPVSNFFQETDQHIFVGNVNIASHTVHINSIVIDI